jgi:hypothetical protein
MYLTMVIVFLHNISCRGTYTRKIKATGEEKDVMNFSCRSKSEGYLVLKYLRRHQDSPTNILICPPQLLVEKVPDFYNTL